MKRKIVFIVVLLFLIQAGMAAAEEFGYGYDSANDQFVNSVNNEKFTLTNNQYISSGGYLILADNANNIYQTGKRDNAIAYYKIRKDDGQRTRIREENGEVVPAELKNQQSLAANRVIVLIGAAKSTPASSPQPVPQPTPTTAPIAEPSPARELKEIDEKWDSIVRASTTLQRHLKTNWYFTGTGWLAQNYGVRKIAWQQAAAQRAASGSSK